MFGFFIRIETKAGEPIVAGDATVTPLARSLILRLPGKLGGLVWNRPIAVRVQTGHGEKRTLPIPDVTRQAQLRLFGTALILAFLIGLILRRWQCKSPSCNAECS
ncbi:MAG: hypothetical protein ACUVWR_12310 [Anaerolineae bacterium]